MTKHLNIIVYKVGMVISKNDKFISQNIKIKFY